MISFLFIIVVVNIVVGLGWFCDIKRFKFCHCCFTTTIAGFAERSTAEFRFGDLIYVCVVFNVF
ncbi:hypothetical protein OIU77_004888 [Salix suchowensis]|uniref:Uncharacterized protein n=1 Tax=Salix suchowensis TaxID=1278906 RepID=A0ABQ9AXI2_9ROSI|nr:hypothetical protein OIU77_004888 [Salix suchowensis]